MKIKTLMIDSFKGVAGFNLHADGKNINVSASNGVGKTTISDAWSWLIRGKDSLDRSDFGIIPTGDPEASPRVSAILSLPDGDLALCRQLVQKTASVRGAEPTAAGTTTEFYINGVPDKKTEYQRCVASLADEALFPLLTDVHNFCGTLHWQKRRQWLLSMFCLTTDADIMAGEPELAGLPEMLGRLSVAEHRRKVAPRAAELKKLLDAIPARINEVERGIPPAPEGDPAADLETLREGRRWTQANLERIANGGEIAELRRQLAEVNAEMANAVSGARRAKSDAAAVLLAALDAARTKQADAQHWLRDAERREKLAQQELARIEAQQSARVDEYEDAAAEQPPEVGFDDTCPACNQSLPPEHVKVAAESAIAEFMAHRSTRLEAIIESQRRLDIDHTAAETRLKDISATLAARRTDLDLATRAMDDATATIRAAQAEPAHQSDLIVALSAKAAAITARITDLENSSDEALSTTRAALDQIDLRIAASETACADIRAREQARQRIDELKAERRTLAGEADNIARGLALCDRFTRIKISQVTATINSRFGNLRWKLFDQQVNGDVVDCCELTLNGVEWRDLSNSQQINAGLEVIDVIGNHYGVTPPIFIDNAESVTHIRPTTAQQIRLIVSPEHKQLTVEVGP